MFLTGGGMLEMSLGCNDVPKMDVLSNSDPFCVVYSREGIDCWKKHGFTETIIDNHNCRWVRKFFINATLAQTEVRFEVYDRDSKRDDLRDHDFIGYVEGRLVTKMLNEGKTFINPDILREGSNGNNGTLYIALDWIEAPRMDIEITLKMQVKYSTRVKLYYQIMKESSDGSQNLLVYRSKLLEKNEVKFEPTILKLTQLSGGSTSRALRIELFVFHPMGKNKLLGFVKTSVDELAKTRQNVSLKWNSCSSKLQNAVVFASSEGDTMPYNKTFEICVVE